MTTITLAEFLQKNGLPPIDPKEYEDHYVADIGDLRINASQHSVSILCDDEIVLTLMRKDGGLRELAEVLSSLVVE